MNVILYICSTQFANLHNFKIVLHKSEIVYLLTNFKIALPLLCVLKMRRKERTTNLLFLAGRQSTSFNLRGEELVSWNAHFFTQNSNGELVSILSGRTIFCPLSFKIVLLVSIGIAFFAERFKCYRWQLMFVLPASELSSVCTISKLDFHFKTGHQLRNF